MAMMIKIVMAVEMMTSEVLQMMMMMRQEAVGEG